MIEAYGNLVPSLNPTAWVHSGAHVMGDVVLHERVSIWPTTVLRGDQGRITIGADVAITSVICQRVARLFPAATISVIGNAKLGQVFSEHSGIEIHELNYARRGGLMERFLVWLEL